MEFFLYFLVFFFGAAVGSFVNVIADRYDTESPWWKGKSFCFACKARLKALDLFPIFSFLFLGGRCRYCNTKIPKSAIITEVLMGALSLLAFYKTGLNWIFLWDFLVLMAIFAILLLIAVYDLRHLIIPDAFLVALLIFSFFHFFLNHNSLFLIPNIVAGLLLALPFLLLFLVSRGRWLGFGDVKFIAVIGFLLGLTEGISVVTLSFWMGAVSALLLLFLGRKNLTMKSELPFGPFLSIGAISGLVLELDILGINEILKVL